MFCENISRHLLLQMTGERKPLVRGNVQKILKHSLMQTTTHFFCQEPIALAQLILCFILGETFLQAPGCSLTADIDIYKQEPS